MEVLSEEAILDQIWRDCWRPPDRRPPWAWAEDNIASIPYSPIPGRFRADNSPWVKAPLEALVDPRIKVVYLMACVQASKTLIAEIGSAYIIANMPGPMLWLDQTDEDARDQAESRLGVLYDQCEAVKSLYPANRHKLKTATKHFNNGMSLWVLGASNKTNLQRRSIRWLIGDETWRWPTGHMAEAEARTTAFGWLGKCLFMSQGGEDDDDSHRKFLMTNQNEWTFSCLECEERQPFKWSNVEWSRDARGDDDEWNYAQVRATTVLRCEYCGHRYADEDRNRRLLNATGQYVPQNPTAASEYVGFHWNALCSMSWGRLAELYLRAKHATKSGDIEPLKIFYQKRLGLPWREDFDDFQLEIQPGQFVMGDAWEREAGMSHSGKILPAPYEPAKAAAPLRMLTVDCQMDHLFALARSWAADGSSRLLYHERILTFEDVETLRERFGIHRNLVFVDAGHATYHVYQQCAKYGWTALMGDSRLTYQHRLKDGRKVHRFYSPKRKVSLTHSANCSVFYWSNLNIKDMLARLRRNQDPGQGPTWEIPEDAGEDYLRQMESEKRIRKNEKWLWQQIGDRANHLWDCEAMQVTAAVMLKLIGRESGQEADEN